MSTPVQSIFGPYANRLQVVINTQMNVFKQPWYTQYFTFAPPQVSLTFVSAIGRTRIEAAASVTNEDSKAPLRSRPPLEKLQGEVKPISEKFEMKKSDYRDFLALQNLTGVDDATKTQQLLDFMFGDVKRVADAVNDRVDMFCLQAVSTGTVTIDNTTNPDGLNEGTIDLLMPSGNKVNSTITWGDVSSNPLTVDIPAIVQAAAARGIQFSKMLMSWDLWYKFMAITEVQKYIAAAQGLRVTGANAVTLQDVNGWLNRMGYPVIELVNRVIGIEKDGVIATMKPFNVNNVSFIPDGTLGQIKNAVPIEKISPVPQKVYANVGQTLISKWHEHEPFAEYTKGELIAFPAFDTIESVYILTAVH